MYGIDLEPSPVEPKHVKTVSTIHKGGRLPVLAKQMTSGLETRARTIRSLSEILGAGQDEHPNREKCKIAWNSIGV